LEAPTAFTPEALVAAFVVIVYSFVVTFGIWKVIGLFMPLKMSEEQLKTGDAAIHGEEIEPSEEEPEASEMKPAASV
jgi:ammonium transporter, Amt family